MGKFKVSFLFKKLETNVVFFPAVLFYLAQGEKKAISFHVMFLVWTFGVSFIKKGKYENRF